MSENSLPIVYLSQQFPALTQTFVYREVLALRRQGITIYPFSVWRPKPADRPPEVASLARETFYVFPLRLVSLLRAHIKYIFRQPFSYLRTFIFVITQPGEPPRNRLRSLVHFIYGMVAVREIERLHARHIHAHFGWSASSIALIANRLIGIPFSLTLHSNDIYFERILLNSKMRFAAFIITISEYNQKFLQKLSRDDAITNKIKIVRCGLDPHLFTPADRYKKDSKEFRIVSIGQLVPRKGFHVLIRACKVLMEGGVDFQCHIFGEGPERSFLEKLIRKWNLLERVILCGRIYQTKLRYALEGADVFALPCVRHKEADQDGIPVVLMEAMAMGIPVVSTMISGIPELIDNNDSGLLTREGDAESLADCLQRLFSDAGLRRRLGKNGRSRVLEGYNIHTNAAKLAELFRSSSLETPTRKAVSH